MKQIFPSTITGPSFAEGGSVLDAFAKAEQQGSAATTVDGKMIDVPVVLPMDFLRVPLSAAAGWLIYSERLDLFTVLGAALILTGNLLNLKPAPSTKASAPG